MSESGAEKLLVGCERKEEQENVDVAKYEIGMLIDPNKKDGFDKAANEYFKKCSNALLRGDHDERL